jgi:hypothetical protein
MPLPGPPVKQTREELERKRIFDPKVDKETDKKTASNAIRRGEREPVEVIKNDKVADKLKLSATSNAISSKTEEPRKTDATLKGSVATKAAAEKKAADEKKAVAAAVTKPDEREVKRPRSL